MKTPTTAQKTHALAGFAPWSRAADVSAALGEDVMSIGGIRKQYGSLVVPPIRHITSRDEVDEPAVEPYLSDDLVYLPDVLAFVTGGAQCLGADVQADKLKAPITSREAEPL